MGDLTASIRSLGLLQPLLVRRNGQGFDIIAGHRRFRALSALAEESTGIVEPVPCILMEEGDDARAVEASLAENIARLPMDEIDQFKAFALLRDEGLSVADIAGRFGVTKRLVERRLAIAGIIAPILNAYRSDEISADTLQILTMATPKQQKAWWKLHKREDGYAPTGHALKQWLFGGNQVPVSHALFDVDAYDGVIVTDLFGDERYFADTKAFWAKQSEVLAARRRAYLDAGWSEVVVLDFGQPFAVWNHRKVSKKKGGKVFVTLTHRGEVTFHEGYLSHKEADRTEEGKAADVATAEQAKPERPELTSALRNYLGLHKHAAVRTELLSHPTLALRLAVAHIVAGSPLWTVKPDPQKPASEAIGQSLAEAKAQAVFENERGIIAGWLGIETEGMIVVERHGFRGARRLEPIFQALDGMTDAEVLRILGYVMAETLAAHTPLIEMLGTTLGIDMRQWWTPDQTFFDLLRDKAAIHAMLGEVASEITADAHVASTAKVQKKIIADCLSGNGRAKVEGWLPRYMQFPAKGYTSRIAGEAGNTLDTGAEADESGNAEDDEAVADAA